MAYTTIDKPSDYFNTVLWSGDSTASRNITGVGFQPDWVWQKCRSHAVPHLIYDSVRGAGNDKELSSNSTAAEGGQSAETDGFMSAFISDGFTVEDGSGGNTHYVNLSGRTFTAWNWLAGGTASSNTDGSITSTVSANTTAGFSIVSFTSPALDVQGTVGHGLSQTPEFIITKSRQSAYDWQCFNSHMNNATNKYITLNSTAAEQTYSTVWGASVPTSSVFGITGGRAVTASQNAIAYCFHSVKGFSKMGKYTGNGNADGTFVYTGFKPAWILLKRTDTTASWFLYDNKRDSYNEANASGLYPNLSNVEFSGTSNVWDFTSNGFKGRASTSDTNASGGTYIYMAFAENPFVTSTGIPTTAR